MSDTQLPKALQLAEKVVSTWAHKPPEWAIQTAGELRRLHAELEQARAALAAQGEPVARVELITAGGNAGIATRIVEIDVPSRERLRHGAKLYTAQPAPAKPMTDEVIIDAIIHAKDDAPVGFMAGVRFAEAHHGITDKVGA